MRSRRLVKYIKEKYPDIYSKNFEQQGFIVDTITPNLFLISSDARKIAQDDIQFKMLRRRYGIASLLIPIWPLFLTGCFVVFYRFFPQ